MRRYAHEQGLADFAAPTWFAVFLPGGASPTLAPRHFFNFMDVRSSIPLSATALSTPSASRIRICARRQNGIALRNREHPRGVIETSRLRRSAASATEVIHPRAPSDFS